MFVKRRKADGVFLKVSMELAQVLLFRWRSLSGGWKRLNICADIQICYKKLQAACANYTEGFEQRIADV